MPIVVQVLIGVVCGCSTHADIKDFQAKQADESDYIDTIENVPLFLEGCSWYCAGSVSKVEASTPDSADDPANSSSANVHDFDLNNAWVASGTAGGVGEYLIYHFDMTEEGNPNLGITTIILSNGYRRSEEAWREYGRVKEMKMYVNGEPYATLHLLDVRVLQTIEIGKIMLPPGTQTILRLEIVEIYSGDKERNPAISELVFDGVGAH